MPDLLDKLNVLVRASLNNVLSSDKSSGARRIPPERLGKDIDSEIGELRKHIDDALDAEEAMQKRLDSTNAGIADLDQQADQALLDGDDAQARYLVQQIQRQKQQAVMQQASLEEHRRATSELIERVNTLEAMVSESRRNPPVESVPSPATETTIPLSNMLRDAREQVDQEAPPSTGRSIPIKIHRETPPAEPTVNDQIKAEVDQAKVEDDLADRRKRLSS